MWDPVRGILWIATLIEILIHKEVNHVRGAWDCAAVDSLGNYSVKNKLAFCAFNIVTSDYASISDKNLNKKPSQKEAMQSEEHFALILKRNCTRNHHRSR